MSYAQNRRSFESTTSYATLWSQTDWNKIEKYVDKQQCRIYRAESEGDKRKVRDLQMLVNLNTLKIVRFYWLNDLDKGLFEPYVLKGTRTVLRRVRGSNASILSD